MEWFVFIVAVTAFFWWSCRGEGPRPPKPKPAPFVPFKGSGPDLLSGREKAIWYAERYRQKPKPVSYDKSREMYPSSPWLIKRKNAAYQRRGRD